MLDEIRQDLDPVSFRRARHVVEEDARVLDFTDALAAGNVGRAGRLLAESHASLRDLFEVSSPELDALVEITSAVPGVAGSRMTGAGFGGCTVSLVAREALPQLRESVARQYPARTGRQAAVYDVAIVDGAGMVET